MILVLDYNVPSGLLRIHGNYDLYKLRIKIHKKIYLLIPSHLFNSNVSAKAIQYEYFFYVMEITLKFLLDCVVPLSSSISTSNSQSFFFFLYIFGTNKHYYRFLFHIFCWCCCLKWNSTLVMLRVVFSRWDRRKCVCVCVWIEENWKSIKYLFLFISVMVLLCVLELYAWYIKRLLMIKKCEQVF